MSDQTATLNLILQLKAQTDDLRRGQQEVLAFKNGLADLNAGLGAVGKGFASGLGLGGALTALGAVKSLISEAVGGMKALIVEGVNLNAQMETAQFSIAGALRQFLPERFKDFGQALAGSANVIDALKQKSLQLGLSFPDLAHTYQATLGSMFKAGIYDIQKQIDLTALLSRTLASQGVTGARAARDIADLFNGQANRIVALKGLQLTNEEINAAKAKGELFEYITGKLAGFKEAVDAANTTTERLESVLSATTANVAAEATKELTNSYKELLISLNALVKSDGFVQMLKFVAGAAKGTVDAASAVSKFGTSAQNALSGGPKSEAGYQDAKGALNSDTVTGLATALGQLGPLLVAKAAFGTATNVAQAHYNNPGPTGRREASEELDAEISRKHSTVDTEAAPQIAAAEAAAKFRVAEEEAGEFLAKNATKIETLNDKLSLVGLKDEERLSTLKEIATIKNDEFDERAARVQAGSNQAAVIEFERKKALLPVLNQIAATEAKISAEKERQDNLTEAAGVRLHKLAEQDAARVAVAKTKSTLDDVEAAKSLIVNDRYQTRLEKQAAVYELLKKEPALIDEIIKRLETLSANTSDESTKHTIDTEISSLQHRKKGIPAQSEAVAPQSSGQDIQSNLVGLQNNFATVGQTISATMSGAIDSLSTGIQGLFDKTKTLGQGIRGVFLGIGQSAVKAVSDMAAQWVIKHTLMAAITKIFYGQETVAHVGSELVKTHATVAGETVRSGVTLHASIGRRAVMIGETIFHGIQTAIRTAAHIASEIAKTAVSVVQGGIRIAVIIAESLASVIQGAVQAFSALSSIPYVGPFLGAAAMAAALVAGIALVGGIKKNFADGGAVNKPGYVAGAGGPRSDKVPANLSNGEYVLNAQTTSRIGKERLDAMNFGGELPKVAGGGVGPGHSGGGTGTQRTSPQHTVLAPHFIMVDSPAAAQRIADSTANEAYVIKVMRKHGAI